MRRAALRASPCQPFFSGAARVRRCLQDRFVRPADAVEPVLPTAVPQTGGSHPGAGRPPEPEPMRQTGDDQERGRHDDDQCLQDQFVAGDRIRPIVAPAQPRTDQHGVSWIPDRASELGAPVTLWFDTIRDRAVSATFSWNMLAGRCRYLADNLRNYETARSRLKTIFMKVWVRRQTDLVLLLMEQEL